jgi:APA family basic amino acid/polyamine antiporter
MAERVPVAGRAAGLSQSLSLLDATTLVMGSMIGSGIFIVPADIARQVDSPALLMAVWLVTALMTWMAALCYGELASALPQAGGQYVYLREAFGPLCGFLYGWTLFLVIQTGTIAAVAVAFAKFAGVWFPAISASHKLLPFLSTQQLTAIGVLIVLTAVNTRQVKTGALVQNIFTAAKTTALGALIVAGFSFGRNPAAVESNFGDFWRGAEWSWDVVRVVGVAMVGALFSSDAWNNVTFTAAEVQNPRRTVPRALVLGVTAVSVLYLLCNLSYLQMLTLEEIKTAPEDRVATQAVLRFLGPAGALAVAAAIMISTFGCVNGMVLAGARAYYAMAEDGLFFRRAAELHPVQRTPVVSLMVQCAWACLLTLTGAYSDLLDYVIFAVLLFYMLTIAALFRLRRTRPNLERYYRAAGYPLVPALYIALAALTSILLLRYKPTYTWPGLLIVLLGVPVYFLWRKRGNTV